MAGNVNPILSYLSGDSSKGKSEKSLKPGVEEKKLRFEQLFSEDWTWKKDKKRAEDFYDGYHWTSEELEALRDRAQPSIVINRIKPAIDLVVGLSQRFRQRVRAFPRDTRSDQGSADAMSECLRFVDQNNRLEYTESEVFFEGVSTGRGWFYTFVELDDQGSPEIKVRWVPGDDILFDRTSREYDLTDAKDLAHTVWMDPEDLVALYPRKKRSIMSALNDMEYDRFEGFTVSKKFQGDDYSSVQDFQSPVWYHKKRKQARVVNYWYRKNEMRKHLIHPDLGIHMLSREVSGEDIEEILSEVEKQSGVELEVIERNVKIAYSCLHIGNLILEDKPSIFDNAMFPYVPFFCFRQFRNGDHYGLIRQGIDAQTEYNKRRSKALHILNSKRVEMEDGAVEDEEELREELARPDGIIRKRRNHELKITEDTSLGTAQLEMYQASKQELDESMGVNRDLAGQATNARSGRAIDIRQQQGLTVLATVFTNWKRTKLLLADQLVAFIQEFWSPEKAIRVTDDQQVVKFIHLDQMVKTDEGSISFHDFKNRKFDLILDTAEDSLNLMEDTFGELAKLAQTGMIPPEILFQFAPVPYETKQRIISQLSGGQSASAGGTPPPGAPTAAQQIPTGGNSGSAAGTTGSLPPGF